MTTRNTIARIPRGAILAAALLIPLVAATIPAGAADDTPRSLFREGQKALDDGRYGEAIDLFEQAFKLDRESDYADDALYWYAFALEREGGKRNLKRASRALEDLQDRFPDSRVWRDAEALQAKVLALLAERYGDPDAGTRIERESRSGDEDMEMKLATLQALVNMRSERAMPILKKVLAKRDEESAELRAQALFLLAQHGDDEEAADILLDLARNDPDREVREQAVFWLSQISSDRALDYIEDLLKDPDRGELSESALFAISQHRGERASRLLREMARDENLDEDMRTQAIYWLGQSGGPEDIEILKKLFFEVQDEDAKEAIIMGVAQSHDDDSGEWLTKIVFDEDQPSDVRQIALHWAGQSRDFPVKKLVSLYDEMKDVELREQVLFALSQRHEPEAADAMFEIARREKNVELRKMAIFWISQLDDDRVEDFLLEIIDQ